MSLFTDGGKEKKVSVSDINIITPHQQVARKKSQYLTDTFPGLLAPLLWPLLLNKDSKLDSLQIIVSTGCCSPHEILQCQVAVLVRVESVQHLLHPAEQQASDVLQIIESRHVSQLHSADVICKLMYSIRCDF